MPPLLQRKTSSYKSLLLRQTRLRGALLEGIQRCCAWGHTLAAATQAHIRTQDIRNTRRDHIDMLREHPPRTPSKCV